MDPDTIIQNIISDKDIKLNTPSWKVVKKGLKKQFIDEMDEYDKKPMKTLKRFLGPDEDGEYFEDLSDIDFGDAI